MPIPLKLIENMTEPDQLPKVFRNNKYVNSFTLRRKKLNYHISNPSHLKKYKKRNLFAAHAERLGISEEEVQDEIKSRYYTSRNNNLSSKELENQDYKLEVKPKDAYNKSWLEKRLKNVSEDTLKKNSKEFVEKWETDLSRFDSEVTRRNESSISIRRKLLSAITKDKQINKRPISALKRESKTQHFVKDAWSEVNSKTSVENKHHYDKSKNRGRIGSAERNKMPSNSTEVPWILNDVKEDETENHFFSSPRDLRSNFLSELKDAGTKPIVSIINSDRAFRNPSNPVSFSPFSFKEDKYNNKDGQFDALGKSFVKQIRTKQLPYHITSNADRMMIDHAKRSLAKSGFYVSKGTIERALVPPTSTISENEKLTLLPKHWERLIEHPDAQKFKSSSKGKKKGKKSKKSKKKKK